jgi:hypothetical protein
VIPADLQRALRESEELEIITTGRRSGARHAVKVWFAFDGDSVWLRTDRDADWLRNLDRDPKCVIRAGGIEHPARREPVDDEEGALRALVDLWRAKYGQEYVADWYVERGRVPVQLIPE